MVSDESGHMRSWAVRIGGIFILLVVPLIIWSRWPPPQLSLVDEQVLTTVDALFSAVTSKDTGRLEDSQRRLVAYRQEEKISSAVLASLESIIQQARSGEWEPAAKRLYDFIAGQRGKKN